MTRAAQPTSRPSTTTRAGLLHPHLRRPPRARPLPRQLEAPGRHIQIPNERQPEGVPPRLLTSTSTGVGGTLALSADRETAVTASAVLLPVVLRAREGSAAAGIAAVLVSVAGLPRVGSSSRRRWAGRGSTSTPGRLAMARPRLHLEQGLKLLALGPGEAVPARRRALSRGPRSPCTTPSISPGAASPILSALLATPTCSPGASSGPRAAPGIMRITVSSTASYIVFGTKVAPPRHPRRPSSPHPPRTCVAPGIPESPVSPRPPAPPSGAPAAGDVHWIGTGALDVGVLGAAAVLVGAEAASTSPPSPSGSAPSSSSAARPSWRPGHSRGVPCAIAAARHRRQHRTTAEQLSPIALGPGVRGVGPRAETARAGRTT